MTFRKPWLIFALSLMLGGSPVTGADDAARFSGDKHFLSIPQLATKIKKSLVTIVTQDRAGKDVSQGSGFFISPRLIATNLHVLKRASGGYIKVASSAETLKITAVFGVNPEHDVCVLYVSDARGIGLPGSPEIVQVGEEVVVAGNPEGLEASFSRGIVSAIRQNAGLIQMDAAISPGSSGGPVVDRAGEVIGISVSTLSEGQNLNFAVPIQFLGDIGPVRNIDVGSAGRLAVSDLENEGFKGPVQEYTESSAKYSTNPGGDLRSPTTYSREVFNTSGRLTERSTWAAGAKARGKTTWEYSSDGLLKRATMVDTDGSAQDFPLSPEDAISVYGARIHADGDELYGLEGDPYRTIRKYDSGGHLIEFHAPHDDLRSVTRYDDKGRAVEELVYKHDRRFSVTLYTYESNSRGDWIQRYDVLCSATFPPSDCFPYAEEYRDIRYFGGFAR
jgi:hypothetical protein